MKNPCPLFLAILSVCFFADPVYAQSCCDGDSDIILCYLSAADFCASNQDNCNEYSLDGAFMENGLAEKLASPQNFGPNGTVDCNLVFKKLENITGVQTINDDGCDIVFVPVVALDPVTLINDLNETYIPQNILDAIYQWSTVCESNLVVVTQAEAKTWGYTMENANVNPNTPVNGSSLFSIFNGPFGTLPFFNQGGTFQGVFTGTPASGVEILANDVNGNPTVGLDMATNDIVVGDIGIFCSGGAGVVSPGPGISNNNDILVCNIFALACQLAEDMVTTTQIFEICPGETVTLPDGQVVGALGTYVDTLTAFNGCDSIVITEVADHVIPPTDLTYNGCDGDGYSIIVNGQVYNQAYPSGQETFTTSGGCDSLVNVSLSFTAPSFTAVTTVLCAGEWLVLSNGDATSIPGIYVDTLTASNGCDSIVTIDLSFTSPISATTAISTCPDEPLVLSNGTLAAMPGSYVDTLVASNGCDSVLFIELSFYRTDSTYFIREICPGETVAIDNLSYGAGSSYAVVATNIFGCDSLLVTNLVAYPPPLVNIDTFVQVTQSVISPFNNHIPPHYGIEWSPSEVLSCPDCPNPVILSNNGVTMFQISLTDSTGCVWKYPISVEYVCNVFVPNAFSPNGDGINDLFQPFSSGCPVQAFSMDIFDRWGGKVFHAEDLSAGWDGTFHDKVANPGVYVYLIKLKEFGRDQLLSGEVLLLR
ncbi:MAG: gliding motility-associated C-terminal domain-containing protein [Lewinellaceae bacterium]|nr:gliding motility-associated C-terminal domain-containing protein [Lewinellaceae bacterium]